MTLKRVCDDNYLPAYTIHGFRATKLVAQIDAGVPEAARNKLQGWTKSSTTWKQYAQLLAAGDDLLAPRAMTVERRAQLVQATHRRFLD